MVRNRSWPAVSHYLASDTISAQDNGRTICSLTVLPSSSIVRIFYGRVSLHATSSPDDRRTKSTPMVEM